MSTSIAEGIKDATEALVRHWHELPDSEITVSDVPERRVPTPKQGRLLRALGSLLSIWPDQETAKSVEITLGFREKLQELPPGKPMILTVACQPEFQVEVIRLSELVKTVGPFMCLGWCCCKDGQLYCCKTLSELELSK